MAINLRGSMPIPDGSITEAKLADNSVSSNKIQTNAVIEAKIATDAVSNAKLAANAVTETKIANDAVSTNKITNDAVTTDKITANIAMKHFFGSEVELYLLGNVETSVAEFTFIKDSTTDVNGWNSVGYSVKLKSSNVANTATFNLYIDSNLVSTQTSTSLTYESFTDGPTALSLANGDHFVELKLVNSSPTETAYIGAIDLYLSQK